jgi:hypothetical protein
MKSIRFKIIALLAVMLISVASFAKNEAKKTADQRATIQMQKINSICTLTTQQQTQVKQLYLNAITNRKASEAAKKGNTIKGTANNKTTLKAALKAEKHQNRVDLKTVLTTAQLSKLKASRQSK